MDSEPYFCLQCGAWCDREDRREHCPDDDCPLKTDNPNHEAG